MISEAVLEDIFEIESIIKVAAQEEDYSKTSYNRERALLAIYGNIIADHQCMFVYRRDDKVVGIYAGYITNWILSDELVAQDMTWFVLPEYRKGRAAIALLKAFEQWAISKGASSICPGSMTGGAIDRIRKLYERLGYKTIGYNFRKDLV